MQTTHNRTVSLALLFALLLAALFTDAGQAHFSSRAVVTKTAPPTGLKHHKRTAPATLNIAAALNAFAVTEQAKLTDALGGEMSDELGFAVAISGSTAIVGVPHDESAGNQRGSALVFTRTGAMWSLQQKLAANDAADGDGFGFSVALDGDTAVIGARNDDITVAMMDHQDQGSVYVFTRSGGVWTQQQKLTASDGDTADQLGYAVSVETDTLIAGAFLGDPGNRGAAYVFTRSMGVWTQQQKLNATAMMGVNVSAFGQAVGVDGETVIVGAPFTDLDTNFNDEGAAYIFVRSGGVWTQQQMLTGEMDPFADPSAEFGVSVGISGNSVIVGSPLDTATGDITANGAAYVFTRTGMVWTLQQRLDALDNMSNVGRAVAIDGDRCVIGGASNAAFLYERVAGVWGAEQKLTGSDSAVGDKFSASVEVDNCTVIVGAPLHNTAGKSDQGAAYIFADCPVVNTPPTITPTAMLPAITQGATQNDVQIATVNDTEDNPGTLAVTVTSANPSNGVTLSDIQNNGGVITADIVATCTATPSPATFTLQVSDSEPLTNTGMLNLPIAANTLPTLTYNNPAAIVFGSGMVINPAMGPSDNGTINSILVQNQGMFTGLATVNNATGVVTLSNAAPVGTHLITVRATDNCGMPTDATFMVTVSKANTTSTVVSSVNPAVFGQSVAFTATVSAATPGSGTPTGTVTFSLDGLPQAPVPLNGAGQAVISTNSLSVGDHLVSATYSGDLNFIGSTSSPLSQKVVCATITLPTSLANGVVGTPYAGSATANPLGPSYNYAVAINLLPPGLTLNAASGAITGTPLAAGNFTFAIKVTEPSGCTQMQTYNLLVTSTCASITVNPSALPAGTHGTAYNQAVSATGGTAPYTFSVVSGVLPSGLTLNALSGEISGTPTVAGTSVFTIRATGLGGCTGQRVYVLTIHCAAVTINPATLPNGTKNVAYSQTLATIPSGTYTFNLQTGSLPPGLTLSSAGILSGTSSVTGTHTFTVRARTASGCQGLRLYTLTINP